MEASSEHRATEFDA